MKEMRSIESSGRSIDEAIYKGLRELGISIDEVDIEVVQHEQKGVFGLGSKPAIVRLIEREPEDIMAQLMATDSPAPRRDERERRNDRPRQDRPQGERRNDRPRQDRPQGERRNDRPRQDRPQGDRQQGDRQRRDFRRTEEPRVSPYVYEKSTVEGEPAAEFLAETLKLMGIKAELLGAHADGALRIRIDSDAMGILIGHRGETLDALQYLTGLAVNKSGRESEYARITLDVEGYREKREETLTRLARRVAGQVRQSGKPRAMEPMNPYERRILHSALQGNPYVETHSEGEGLDRRVVIAPKTEKQ